MGVDRVIDICDLNLLGSVLVADEIVKVETMGKKEQEKGTNAIMREEIG